LGAPRPQGHTRLSDLIENPNLITLRMAPDSSRARFEDSPLLDSAPSGATKRSAWRRFYALSTASWNTPSASRRHASSTWSAIATVCRPRSQPARQRAGVP
jgi:hypothetical protein